MSDPVIVELTIAAPAEVVWRALRDPEQIRRWHGWEYDGIEEEIRMIYLDDVDADEARLTLDTRGGGRFELEPHGAETVVRLTRAAPAGTTGWDGIHDEINEGWLSFLQQLRFFLERHPGEERRTLLIEREVTLPDGEPWFRSAHQTGVVVGERTLVTVAHGKTIVSSYGLGEDDFARLGGSLDGAGPAA